MDNKHSEIDEQNLFYCKTCKDEGGRMNEIAECADCLDIVCETLDNNCFIFLRASVEIDPNSVTAIDMNPNHSGNYIYFNPTPTTPYGIGFCIECRLCFKHLGWYVAKHNIFRQYRGLYVIKRDLLV
jgi:hypothetical protein